MSNMVTHTFDSLPGYLRSEREQLLVSPLVNTFDTFANGLNQHTVSRQRLHSIRGGKQVVDVR